MALADRIPQERRATVALLAVLIGSTGIQTTSAVASTLFDAFGPVAVSGLRMFTAAILLLAVARPRFWRFTRQDWLPVTVYGVVTCLMNIFFYLAVQRLPLGIAVTFEYLGAFTVAVMGVRKLRDMVFPVLALVGVVLIAGPTVGDTDPLGYVFAVCSAASMAGYTLLSARIGAGSEASQGIKGLAVSIALGAVLTSPFSVPAMRSMTGHDWLLAAFIGAFGLALAFSCDSLAARLTGPAVVGVFFSLDPVVSSVVGTAMLAQVLGANTYAGIALIVVSGAAVTWRTNRSAAQITTATQALQTVRRKD